MKNNEEFLKKASEAFAGVMNGTLTSKELKAIDKELAAHNRQQVKEIKEFKRISKIAKKRNELSAYKSDSKTIYGIPATSKEFYFQPGSEPEGRFRSEGIEYIIILTNEPFSF